MRASYSAIPEKLNCPLYENFDYKGSVLPCRPTVYYNKKQKKITVAVFYGW